MPEPGEDVPPVIVVVMGVAGCGKSTVGRILAERLGCRFIEGDEYHSEASRAKMASGVPLSDEDRWPWLDALAGELARQAAAGESAVLACSALRRAYRERLRVGYPDLVLVHLVGNPRLIAERLGARRGHYMPVQLLASQLETLEPPAADEHPVVLEIDAQPADLATAVLRELRLRGDPGSGTCSDPDPV